MKWRRHTPSRDLDEGTRQHRWQGQKNYLTEWIHDLAMLPWVRHIIEMIEKTTASGSAPLSAAMFSMAVPFQRNPKVVMDSTFQAFVTCLFTRLPC
jgi:hypothetical protein